MTEQEKRMAMIGVMKFMFAPHNVGAYNIISKVFAGNKRLIEHLHEKLNSRGANDFYDLFFDLDDEKKLIVIEWILENYDGGMVKMVDHTLETMKEE